MWQVYRDRGVVVLGLSGGGLFGAETPQTVANFRKQTGVGFPLLLGDQSRRAYGRRDQEPAISPFPFDVVLDRDGKIRYARTKYDRAALLRTVDSLLAEPSGSTSPDATQ